MSPSWTESERLAALRGYRILDTAPEEAFDDFVRLAGGICEAPIAVINLIDECRQWFKSEIGLGVRETPLDVSICAYAILQPGLFVVPDTTDDPRFDCNPLVVGAPHLRFYAGAPLETADRLPLGTLCVLDYAPRPGGLTERQGFALQALARQVMAQLELRRALHERTRAEAEKDKLLAEKNLLMQEVHHRVKNSLQMVQNLLHYQSRGATHPDAAAQLRESAARVRTIAAIHDRLYRTESAQAVEIRPYLESLMDGLREAVASTLTGRSIAVDVDDAAWPANDLPPLGLIATELVTNALKYGAGEVGVTFRQPPGGDAATLTVADQGAALAADFDPSRSAGLGMRLVTGLLRARGGVLEIDRGRGTRFCARFPLPAAATDRAGVE